LTRTLSEDTEMLPSLVHKLHAVLDLWPLNVDRLWLFFLPSVCTALHAEARCDRGNATCNTSHRTL